MLPRRKRHARGRHDFAEEEARGPQADDLLNDALAHTQLAVKQGVKVRGQRVGGLPGEDPLGLGEEAPCVLGDTRV